VKDLEMILPFRDGAAWLKFFFENEADATKIEPAQACLECIAAKARRADATGDLTLHEDLVTDPNPKNA
jgi:hypothetical protein